MTQFSEELIARSGYERAGFADRYDRHRPRPPTAVLELLCRQPPAGQLVIADKGFAGADFEQAVAELGALLVRPQRADEPDRPAPAIGRIRQRIESIVNSLKDQLQLERHLARTPEGLICRIAARILALTAAVHLNWQLRRPTRALTAYGH